LKGRPSRHSFPGVPSDLSKLSEEIVSCRACPRLVAWREEVAIGRRRAFLDCDYWGRPVPGFGDEAATVVLVGLAPAAHGANRTGRMFTGDRSGDWLYASLYRTGYANQAESVSAHDGLVLSGAWVTSAVRCAPPQNKPAVEERTRCQPFLERELALLTRRRVVVALGQFGWDASLRVLGPVRPKPRFGHLAEALLPDGTLLIGSYHPSQQNTFTGRLTEAMLDAVLVRAGEAAGAG
jgi:uracil-DNA glycosylase family 4